jgi:hypothetical protein
MDGYIFVGNRLYGAGLRDDFGKLRNEANSNEKCAWALSLEWVKDESASRFPRVQA